MLSYRMAQPAAHFTVASLAEHWAVSSTHIYSLISSGRLGHLRIGNAIRIRQIDVEAFEAQAWHAPGSTDRPTFKLAKRSSHYAVEFWWEGRSHRISTGASDKREAERFLAAFEAGWGKKPIPAQPTIGEIVGGYAGDRASNTEKPLASPGTLNACCNALSRHLGELTPDLLSRERCRDYARKRRAEGFEVGPKHDRRIKPIGDGTIIRELVILRAAFRWAVAERWISADPHVEVPSSPPPKDRWLSRDEARRLVDGCSDFHIRVFTLLALHTAARSGAILDLTWDRVDLDHGRIDYGHGRGNKRRVRSVPVSPELMATLQAARELAQSDHVVEFAGRPVGSVKTGFRAACVRAKLSGATPHTLRHTAATWMAQNGVPMWDIAGYLGHGDLSMVSKVYSHHSPEHMRTASNAIGRISSPVTAKVRVRAR